MLTLSNRMDYMVIALLVVSAGVSAVAASAILSQPSQNSSVPATMTDKSLGAGERAGSGINSNHNPVPPNAAQSDGTATKSSPQNSGPSASGPGNNVGGALYRSSPYYIPASWGAFVGALIWRGKIRSAWCKQGYDYETFRLLARMRGSPIRIKLLSSMSSPKNRLQLANEFQVDWKTIDNHMKVLEKSGLVRESGMMVGTTKFYNVTEHGRRVMSLLSSPEDNVPSRANSNQPFSE